MSTTTATVQGPGQSPVTAPGAAVSEPVSWAIAFLTKLGAPVNASNITGVLAWGQAESGNPSTSQSYPNSSGGWANYNPLNIVAYQGSGATSQGGQQGDIANFGDLTTGASASAQLYLNNPNAAPIVNALRNNTSGNLTLSGLNDAVNQFYGTCKTASGVPASISFAGITPDTTDNPSQTATLDKLTLQQIKSLASPTAGLIGDLEGASGLSAIGDFFKLLGSIPNRVAKDWRYWVEIGAGIGVLILGIVLILHDTGADKRAVEAVGAGAVLA
jgi:hypothetical protein